MPLIWSLERMNDAGRGAVRRLMGSPTPSDDQIAQVIGKSRSHVTNILRLLQLPADVLARAEALISRDTVVGRRYNAQAESEVDTEEF